MEKKMIKSGEEILADIDDTLKHLIENADAIKRISFNTLYTSEVEALQKTQESLLARLIHMNDLLKGPNVNEQVQKPLDSIEKKILRFSKLNAQVINQAEARIKKAKKNLQPRVRLHRRKVKI